MGTTVKPPKNTGGTTYTAGNGLDLSGTEFTTDIKSNGGLVIESTELAVDLGASSITGTLAVGDGGTGATTLTDGGILLGSGTGAITAMSVLANGEMIVGDGTTDPVAESGATLRTSIGVGTTDDVEFNTLTVGDGTNTAPSITNSGDTNTGIYFPGADKVGITAGGTEEVSVSTNGMELASSLGVGTSASGTTGEIRATNDITAFYSSDKRLKDNITPITEPLSKLSQLGGYTFDWIPKEGIHSHEGRDVGVIAQEVEEVLPEVTTTRDNGYKAVKYEKIVPLLIECIKAQQSQIDELKETLYELKK
tara:strand:- start:3126 stop:4049 length:924 start_codon:yes stop_codon:yes gene_type:complete